VLDVERWAEIRRMRFVERLSIREIDRRRGHDRKTVQRAVRSDAPPRSQIAALDERGGELFSRRIVNDSDTFVALLGGLEGESKIALEATYGWEWLADLL
jgi:hypothetical protein